MGRVQGVTTSEVTLATLTRQIKHNNNTTTTEVLIILPVRQLNPPLSVTFNTEYDVAIFPQSHTKHKTSVVPSESEHTHTHTHTDRRQLIIIINAWSER